MNEVESIVNALLETEDSEPVKRIFGIRPLSEEEDDETIKDILGNDYLEEPEAATPLTGEVERFDRWANITIGDHQFCISYLTPVAVYIPGHGVNVTSRDWSPTTKRHIVRWANEIGIGPEGGYRRYVDFAQNVNEVPQEELLELFKQFSSRVRWSKRQVRRSEKLPYSKIQTGLRSGSEDRISIEQYREPRE